MNLINSDTKKRLFAKKIIMGDITVRDFDGNVLCRRTPIGNVCALLAALYQVFRFRLFPFSKATHLFPRRGHDIEVCVAVQLGS
jgi:hypothetical protein